jgi:fatty acid desaturase
MSKRTKTTLTLAWIAAVAYAFALQVSPGGPVSLPTLVMWPAGLPVALWVTIFGGAVLDWARMTPEEREAEREEKRQRRRVAGGSEPRAEPIDADPGGE